MAQAIAPGVVHTGLLLQQNHKVGPSYPYWLGIISALKIASHCIPCWGSYVRLPRRFAVVGHHGAVTIAACQLPRAPQT